MQDVVSLCKSARYLYNKEQTSPETRLNQGKLCFSTMDLQYVDSKMLGLGCCSK